MQVEYGRRSNEVRTAQMRDRLMDAARELFVTQGYAGTSTPAIVAQAQVTRGALYHHFVDKSAIFRAVVERDAAEVRNTIEAGDAPELDPLERLLAGASSYLAAMAVPGRTRLLLIDGPAVLGSAAMREIEALHGDATLKTGLQDAMAAGLLPNLPLAPSAALLSAMFERAALDLAEGGSNTDYLEATRAIVKGLACLARDQSTVADGTGG